MFLQAKSKPLVRKFGSEVAMASNTVHFLAKSFRLRRRISLISFQKVKDTMFSSA